MLKLTQEMFGGNDEEFQRGGDVEDMLAVLMDFFNYFSALTASRRETPTEDLASAIANAKINGEPLSDMDTLSYYVITASAGHDTTSAGIAGGLRAAGASRPAGPAAERHVVDGHRSRGDDPLGGAGQGVHAHRPGGHRGSRVKIAKGEAVYLAYTSGNRDEDVFADPDKFDVGRDPNKHLSFGYGVHFCLGASLARMEMNSFFSELIPRIKSIELNGKPELMATTFVGGLKHLPIRVELK